MAVNADLSLVHVQKTPKMSELDEYIKRLEEEMRKIDGLQRELPLTMLLLEKAIAKLEKQGANQCTEVHEEKEEEVAEVMAIKGKEDEDRGSDLSEKREWMSSVQLWSSDINFNSKKNDTISEPNLRNGGGGFVPLKEQFGFQGNEGKEVLQVLSLPLLTPSMNLGLRSNGRQLRPRNQLQRMWRLSPSRKKRRRLWSDGLHKLFLQALDKLGGSQAATPKLIKQVMEVDGLTGDEIKSHLQKYRIHLRSLANKHFGLDSRPLMANDQLGEISNRSRVPCESSNGISMAA